MKWNFLKLFFALGLLIWLLLQSDLFKLYQIILQLSVGYVLLAFVILLLALIINAIKWYILLRQYNITTLFKLNLVGIYYSLLLPGQFFGEVIKAYRLGKGKQDAEQIAASVAIDKITGILGNMLVGLFGLYATSQILPSILVWTLSLAIIIFIMVLLTAQLLAIPLKRSFHYIIRLFPRTQLVMQQLENLLNAWLEYFKRPLLLLGSILLGIIFQLFNIGITLILAMNLNINITWIDFCWIITIVSLALFLPLTIAGIGIREGVFVSTLALLGVPTEQALALSFSVFGLSLATAIIGGLVELNQAHRLS
ncbi:MAG: lysylphosphatidylglycerol synthase transmembrane domain-containing protein [Candidatus Helarchaeota archaeon]